MRPTTDDVKCLWRMYQLAAARAQLINRTMVWNYLHLHTVRGCADLVFPRNV